MPDETRRYLFRIDAHDTISFVDDAWLRFAEDNDAPELTRDRVVGRSIWSFMTGGAVRGTYEALFDQVRVKGTEAQFPFRCDSPDAIREMALIMRPTGRGGLELDSRLVACASRERIVLFNRWAGRSDTVLKICSFCRKVALGGQWLEADQAVARFGFFQQPEQPRLDEVVCRSCIEALH